MRLPCPNLTGKTVKVHYLKVDGLVSEFYIQVAPGVKASDIREHVPSITLMRRYAGLGGRVRVLRSKLAFNNEPRVGTKAWEAKFEIEKFERMINMRVQKLALDTSHGQARIDGLIEIEDLTEELIKYERILDDVDSFNSPGVGYVAAKRGEVRSIRITESGAIESTTKPIPGAIQISQDEVNILRTLGLDRYEIQEFNIPGRLTASQRQALINKNQTVIKDLTSNFSTQNIDELIQRLTGSGFKEIFEAAGKDGLQIISEIIELERNGKVINFKDWVEFTINKNKDPNNLRNLIAELTEAKRLAASDIEAGKVINIGGDARVVPDRNGRVPASFDITVEERNTGKIFSNVDVTTIENMVTEPDDFSRAIGHAASKVSEQTPGIVESTVRVELPKQKTQITLRDGRDVFFGYEGRYTIIETSGTARRISRDHYEGEGDLFQDLANFIPERVSSADKVDRLNIIDKNTGYLIVILFKEKGNWIVKRMR